MLAAHIPRPVVNLDTGFFSEDRLEDRLRQRFYQDGPRQRGETPPTASQWIDERRRVQQRLGKPSAPLWREFFMPFVQRVEYLAIQLGKMDEALTHNEAVISVQPISPLQKAQNQDKVMVSRSNLGLAFEVFQERVCWICLKKRSLKDRSIRAPIPVHWMRTTLRVLSPSILGGS